MNVSHRTPPLHQKRDTRGVPVSHHSQAAIDALDTAIEQALCFKGDPMGLIERTLQAHPDFTMGWIFQAAWMTQAMETRIYTAMVKAVSQAERTIAHANDREIGHLNAVKAWINGDFHGAVRCWEDVAVTYPHDLLAIMLVHYTDVLLGDVAGQRDIVARVFDLWDDRMPGYEFILGFYSFGLEENRDFTRAEDLARQALSMRPDHPYAVHAVSHVMEMRGQHANGIRFMNERVPEWGRSQFANHLWWHTGLYHLDIEQTDQVFHIFDTHLDSRRSTGDKYEELDAAALLWRMNLMGLESGDRWNHLANKWEPSAEDTLYAFNDVHAMMSFVSDNRTEAQEKLLAANERYVDSASDANVAMSREIGMPFCLAMQAFKNEHYGACVDHLLAVRYKTHLLGGSFAQRDIIGWTLLEAALRDRQFDLALSLANERAAGKPTSVQHWRCVSRAHAGLGNTSKASQADAKAEALLAG